MLVNAHRADHGVGGHAEQRDRHDRDRDIVDRVAIVAVEQALLDAEHLPAQRSGAALLPRFGGELDLVGAGEKRLEGFEDHAGTLFS